MPLPEFDINGDLPVGVHLASLDEVLARFGQGTTQRETVTARLVGVHKLASATGKLERFIIFGSYVTAKPDPNDVDIILVMRDDFREQDHTEEMLGAQPPALAKRVGSQYFLDTTGRNTARNG